MSATNPYKPPGSEEGTTPSETGRSSFTTVICIIIFVSCVIGLLGHATGTSVTPGAPPWYDTYHVSYLILQAACAVGMWFRKPIALFTLAIIVLIDVAVEILVLGEWDPMSIGVAGVMIYFLAVNLRGRENGPGAIQGP